MRNMINPGELSGLYNKRLKEDILSFWLQRSVDNEDGGFYTCFDNYGRQLISQDKYTWSQGRMVWILSKLAGMKNETVMGQKRAAYIGLAERGAKFLMDHCLLENGNCTFIMDKKGRPKALPEGSEYDVSIYADGFVVCGLSRYAAVALDENALKFAINLYDSIIMRIEVNSFKTEPYPVPKGYKIHGLYMFLLNISQELYDAVLPSRVQGRGDMIERLKKRILFLMNEIMSNFVKSDGVILEMIGADNCEKDSLLGRYINPGHSIEDMWFVIHSAIAMNKREYIKPACYVVKKTIYTGWDNQYGGLFLFAGKSGGKPTGSIMGIEDEPMVMKVKSDWDSKLWWPHSEALYATLLCYEQSKDPDFLEQYRKLHEYVFRVFPNPDASIGEWIQIRDRRGNPDDKVVALPVKDPYHIIRNFILIIELLDRIAQQAN